MTEPKAELDRTLPDGSARNQQEFIAAAFAPHLGSSRRTRVSRKPFERSAVVSWRTRSLRVRSFEPYLDSPATQEELAV
jgi:hypothetical protein